MGHHLHLVVEESLISPVRNIIIISLSDLYRRVMFVIAVVRKVCKNVVSSGALSDAEVEGHWIQDCPTNNDREYDNRPRIKRTTGIPRSMLKAVENPNNGQLGQGVMVTPEGGYVVAQPDLYVHGFIAANLRLNTPLEHHGKNK